MENETLTDIKKRIGYTGCDSRSCGRCTHVVFHENREPLFSGEYYITRTTTCGKYNEFRTQMGKVCNEFVPRVE